MTPEITSFPEEELKEIIADPEFSDYDYMLKTVLKDKEHVLSEEGEQLLALGSKVFGGFKEIFGMIDNADLNFGEVTVDGHKVKLSHGVYSVLLANKVQKVRAEAFKTYYKSYIDFINTISQTYVGNVNKDVFLARARKYGSCLEAALASEDVDVKVYNNLLTAVESALPTMHDYIRTRKQVLGLDELHMYDLYVPIVEGAELK